MTISTAIPRGAVAIGLAFVAPIGTAVYAQPTSTGSGQAYPAKNIILVVPYPPGGGNDALGSSIAPVGRNTELGELGAQASAIG